jgi:hypothetical protein
MQKQLMPKHLQELKIAMNYNTNKKIEMKVNV